MLNLDLYRQPFRFIMPDDEFNYRTLCGANLSIITIFLLCFFAGYKLDGLMNFSDYKVQVHETDFYYDLKEPFGTLDGFAVAAAVTSYDGSPLDITDPSIGELKFIAK